MSPGVSTGPAYQPRMKNPVARFLFDHTIDEYPGGGKRVAYLALAVLATIVLYYTYYTQTGVVLPILSTLHMSFAYYVGIVVVSNALGAFASLPASQTDRLGRTNVVIYGVLIVGLLMIFGVPNAHSELGFAIVICLIGIVEGAILVATPALVRDFSPQLGRASAMGFWTVGPVAGSLIVAIVANHTLSHFGTAHWDSQFIIAGIAALVTFVLALFLLKDLSPRLRDQLMVSARDEALVEARARGLTDADVVKATQRPWSQILKWDLIGSAFGISVFLLIYFVAASFFTIYYPTVFKNANGTQFTVSQANGLNQWFWGADIVALIVVGILSDRLRVRKPFLMVGALASMVMLLIFASKSNNPHTPYSTLAYLSVGLAITLAVVFAPWMAGYTESVEAKNPALVATGLALWGWTIRIIVAISFLFLPVVINTVNPIVDNLPVSQVIIHGQSIADWVATHPDQVNFAQSHEAVLKPVQGLPKSVQAGLCASPQSSSALVYAATHLSKAEISALTPALQKQLQADVCPYPDQFAYIATHQAALLKLNTAVGKTAEQWRKWFWVDFAGMVVFLPLIFLTKGRWSPAAAKRDAEEHERRVNEELARVLAEEKVAAGSA